MGNEVVAVFARWNDSMWRKGGTFSPFLVLQNNVSARMVSMSGSIARRGCCCVFAVLGDYVQCMDDTWDVAEDGE